MNYIEYKEGTVYDPAHLRPFNLELAKQGHPVAKMNGNVSGLEVSHMFQNDPDGVGFNVIYWNTFWQLTYVPQKSLMKYLRLAPLAVKDGRALHVGDWIEYRCEFALQNVSRLQVELYDGQLGHGATVTPADLEKLTGWRWPAEVKE